jgi:transcriptional regulator with XRE-family HTH domain
MPVATRGIGDRVQAARARLGWSREALAVHSGLSWSAIAQVETGRRTKLRPDTLAALARALGLSIDYLVDGTLAGPTMLEHSAFCYHTDDQFRTVLAPFLAEGIERSEAVVAVTTAANIKVLRKYLGKDARSVEFIDASGFYGTPSGTLEAYASLSDAKLKAGAPWVRVVGEPMWAGRTDMEVRLWTRYEALINLRFSASPLSFICPYDERSVDPEIVRHAHVTHPHVVDEEGTSHSADYADPGCFALEPE